MFREVVLCDDLDQIEELPNGIYYLLFETGCYTYSTPEGTEGDVDTDLKVYPFVPLREFLKHKKQLLEKPEPEAEELFDLYLYIQQTKPHSIQHDDDDLDSWE